MYTDTNFKTKSALKLAVLEAQAGRRRPVTCYQPGGMFDAKTEGTATIEGPHYPEPHRWWARVELRDGEIIKILK